MRFANLLRVSGSAFLCAVALLAVCFFSGYRWLDRFAFWPGDFLFPFAKQAGVVAFLFGTNGEGAHHGFQLLASLFFWWLVITLLALCVGLAARSLRRVHA